MKNTAAAQTIGTINSKGHVELVKKCVVCDATLLVEKWEAEKDRHDMCGFVMETAEFWMKELVH